MQYDSIQTTELINLMFRLFFFLCVITSALYAAKISPPVDVQGRQFFIVDSDTDTILFEHDANMRMFPSSMTKILTAYLLFEAIQSGKITLESLFTISRKASKTQGTKMYLPQGKTVRVDDLIQGMFVASGNDACVCVAENLDGSEEAFVKRMNQKLVELGCKQSHFMNASGLPDQNHYSTCHDLYIIAKRLYADFPQFQHYFAQQTFTFGKGTHKNLNSALKTFKGADGLKTGHTKIGGYGVVMSAIVNNQRIFVVMNGCKTMVERNRVSDAILHWAYRTFQQSRLFEKGQVIAHLDTWMSDYPHVPVVLNTDVLVTLPRVDQSPVSAELMVAAPLEPPLKAGDKVGELVVTLSDQKTQVIYPVYSQVTLQKAGYLQRLPMILYYLLFGKNPQ